MAHLTFSSDLALRHIGRISETGTGIPAFSEGRSPRQFLIDAEGQPRKSVSGETTNDIFASLTTRPHALAHAYHPEAMPVILTSPRAMTDDMERPDENLTVRQLGGEFGRGFAEADLSTFEGVLLGAADSLLQGMAEAGEDEEVAEAAVDRFRKGARDEWTQVSMALLPTLGVEQKGGDPWLPRCHGGRRGRPFPPRRSRPG
jgi:hypothetical protein